MLDRIFLDSQTSGRRMATGSTNSLEHYGVVKREKKVRVRCSDLGYNAILKYLTYHQEY